MRDLTRAREDMKGLERTTKQRLSASLLRYGRHYDAGKSRWTQAYYRWLEKEKFDLAIQQIVFQEYIDAAKQAEERVAGLEKETEKSLSSWVLAPVEALIGNWHTV